MEQLSQYSQDQQITLSSRHGSPVDTLPPQTQQEKIIFTPLHNSLQEYNLLSLKNKLKLQKFYTERLLQSGRNNLQNTLDMAKRDNLQGAMLNWYLQEDIKNFLGEYAGAVQETRIPYEWKVDTKEIYQGTFNVTDMLKKSAEKDKNDGLLTERTIAENTGFTTAMEMLMTSDAKAVLFLSPPKIADYSFANLLVKKGGSKVENILMRYDEKHGTVEKSREILKSLGIVEPNPNTLINDITFLKNPIALFQTQEGESIIEKTQKTVGYTQEKKSFSDKFFLGLSIELADIIREYTESMQKDSQTGIPSKKSEELLAFIFMQSLELNKNIKLGLQKEVDNIQQKYPTKRTYSQSSSSLISSSFSMQINASDCDRGGFSPSVARDMQGGRFAPNNMMIGNLESLRWEVSLNPQIMVMYPHLIRFHPDYRIDGYEKNGYKLHASYTCNGGKVHLGGVQFTGNESLEEKIKKYDMRLNPGKYGLTLHGEDRIKDGICACCGQDLSCGAREQLAKLRRQLILDKKQEIALKDSQE